MKEKIISFNVDTDVTAIECEFACADVSFEEAADGIFKIEYPCTKNVHIGSGESGLIISQKKRLFGGKQRFKFFVPSHVIPSVKINGKTFDFTISGGIYGELNLNSDGGNVYLSDCVLESVDIGGGEINVSLDCATVKGGFHSQLAKGSILTENTFATRAECRIEHGNIGLVNFNCKDCSFETQKGNITASLAGCENGFNTSIITREGMSNRESSVKSGADGSFHAYAKRGNIVLDFIGEPQSEPEISEEREKENA